jgi:hypothetical protein
MPRLHCEFGEPVEFRGSFRGCGLELARWGRCWFGENVLLRPLCEVFSLVKVRVTDDCGVVVQPRRRGFEFLEKTGEDIWPSR